MCSLLTLTHVYVIQFFCACLDVRPGAASGLSGAMGMNPARLAWRYRCGPLWLPCEPFFCFVFFCPPSQTSPTSPHGRRRWGVAGSPSPSPGCDPPPPHRSRSHGGSRRGRGMKTCLQGQTDGSRQTTTPFGVFFLSSSLTLAAAARQLQPNLE